MKVRANRLYVYRPALFDVADPCLGAREGLLKPGHTVRVVNLPGCPPCNTMAHAHVENPETGDFGLRPHRPPFTSNECSWRRKPHRRGLFLTLITGMWRVNFLLLQLSTSDSP